MYLQGLAVASSYGSVESSKDELEGEFVGLDDEIGLPVEISDVSSVFCEEGAFELLLFISDTEFPREELPRFSELGDSEASETEDFKVSGPGSDSDATDASDGLGNSCVLFLPLF